MKLAHTWLGRIFGGGASEAAPEGDPARVAEVAAVLESCASVWRADGGDVTLVAVREGWIDVRLKGSCAHCYAQTQTLEGLLAPRLAERIPWFEGLRSV